MRGNSYQTKKSSMKIFSLITMVFILISHQVRILPYIQSANALNRDFKAPISVFDEIKDGDSLNYDISLQSVVNETGHTHFFYGSDNKGQLTINFFIDELGLSALIIWEYSGSLVCRSDYFENKDYPSELNIMEVNMKKSKVLHLSLRDESNLSNVIWKAENNEYYLPFLNVNIEKISKEEIIPFSGLTNKSIKVQLKKTGNTRYPSPQGVQKAYYLENTNKINSSKSYSNFSSIQYGYPNTLYLIDASVGILYQVFTGIDPIYEIFLENASYIPSNDYQLELTSSTIDLGPSSNNLMNPSFIFLVFALAPLLATTISFVYLKTKK